MANPNYSPDEDWVRWLTPHELRRRLEKPDGPWSEDELCGRYGFTRMGEIFAVLAGVRNDEGYPVMAEPRGIPRNAAKATKRLARQDRGRAPSHYSRLTLAEMQAFDWEQKVYWLSDTPRDLVHGPIKDMPAMARLLEVMRRMAELGKPDKVRLVFWFNGI